MRVAKFCENNVKMTSAHEVVDALRRNHKGEVDIAIVDCFRRCLQCRVKPFCRIQLTTIEADDANTLLEKILHTVRCETQ